MSARPPCARGGIRPPGFLASERSEPSGVTRFTSPYRLGPAYFAFYVEPTPVPACSRSWNANLAVNMADNKGRKKREDSLFCTGSLVCYYFLFNVSFDCFELSIWYRFSMELKWLNVIFIRKNCINFILECIYLIYHYPEY